MNKRDLIDAISGRLGDKKTATEAVNAVLDTIQLHRRKGRQSLDHRVRRIRKGCPARPAPPATRPPAPPSRWPKSSVPKFRPGADFKAVVNGEKKVAAAKKR